MYVIYACIHHEWPFVCWCAVKKLLTHSLFITWTKWTLTMALPWCQHYKHCPGYYYYYVCFIQVGAYLAKKFVVYDNLLSVAMFMVAATVLVWCVCVWASKMQCDSLSLSSIVILLYCYIVVCLNFVLSECWTNFLYCFSGIEYVIQLSYFVALA